MKLIENLCTQDETVKTTWNSKNIAIPMVERSMRLLKSEMKEFVLYILCFY